MRKQTSNECEWCHQPFRPRRGGSPQRFCGSKCRTAFWTALRQWGERAIAAGILTIEEIKKGDPAACTLLARPTSLVPVDDTTAQCPPRVVPRAESDYTRQTAFEQLLARTIAARRR